MRENTKKYSKISDFDYDLPETLIAQYPLAERSSSRLMVVDPVKQSIAHQQFRDMVDLLQAGDVLVMNNTKVIPARLYGRKSTGGKLECLIERVLDTKRVLAHIRCSKSPKPGSQLVFAETFTAEVLGREDELFMLRFQGDTTVLEQLEQYGHMPLPPYITRSDEDLDLNRYQTVFAQNDGAVAAPTAGLHFDQALLDQLAAKGVQQAFVTLHVGAGTFQPVRVDDLDDHIMHKEYLDVSAATCEIVNRAKAEGRRIVAVGTTSVRCLESAFSQGELRPYCGDTQLFIRPGYQYQCVDALITNFHLPQSTLLMLVSALAGYDLIRQAYAEAIVQQYRFFSYGDAMFIAAS